MCGLLGLLTSSADAPAHAEAVGRAMRCARHRGPDESGTWHDSDVVFGFNRLSIIDVEHSHQPLRWGPSGADDRYAIVFNGEVYNYLELRAELAELGAVFATEGDTEAVVAAYHHWGPAAAARGGRRRLPPVGPGRRPPLARHVRLRDLGPPRASAVRRRGPVRDQAVV